MANYTFANMPSVGISRSKFNRTSQHKTSFNLGDIIPIYCDEVLPGDTRSFDMAALVRMSTPIAPIMDNIYLDIHAFFVPNRIIWTHWKEFMGENNTSAGIPSVSYTIPYIQSGSGNSFAAGSIGDYLGLPVGVNGIFTTNQISCLPFRAYAAIYNRWYRNQNLIAPFALQTGDTNEILVGDLVYGNTFPKNVNMVFKAAKLPDYFTSALPYAQKSLPVKVPLGSVAPVFFRNDATGTTSNYLGTSAGISSGGTSYQFYSGTSSSIDSSSDIKLFADLTNATAATINQLRYAFQLQKLLEKDALYGTRYWEILNAHFGVKAPDASLQDPEYLGGKRININIDQVLSTAGYSNNTSTTVGQPGANSVSGMKGSIFTKSFTEHGYIMICAVARHDQTYMQGINRMWTRSGRFDFYWPVFANLGAQDIKLRELYVQGSTADNGVFGYQEAWAEYRFKPSIATGKLRPTSGNLTYWTLTNNFGSAPTLGQTFIEQDRDNLARALVTGITGPDFIADFYFMDTAVRPMPVYSIPGLIDHH